MDTRNPAEIKTHPTFRELFPIDPAVLERIEADMQAGSYDNSQPIILATWPDQSEPVCLDGHTRLKACKSLGITEVPVYLHQFDSEDEAVVKAIALQRNRRNLSDAEIVNCVRILDQRRKAGRPPKELAPDGANFQQGKSANTIGDLLGINFRKVERVRTVLDHGTPETLKAVQDGDLSVNRAYQMALERKKQGLTPQIRTIQLDEEEFLDPKELAGTVELRSPLKYYGGKSRLSRYLVGLIPEHTSYIEVFCGSCALLFAKEPSGLEIVNDLDGDLVNFYKVLRNLEQHQELIRRLELTPFSREEFYDCRDGLDECEDPIERARMLFVKLRQSFVANGRSFSFAVTDRGATVGGFLTAIEKLPEVHARLRRVQIECLDFREVLKAYDHADALFYCDPPYVPETRKKDKPYKHEMEEQDHVELVEVLLNLKGKAMLSGYENQVYAPLEEAGWRRYDFQSHCHAVSHGRDTKYQGDGSCLEAGFRMESVWISP